MIKIAAEALGLQVELWIIKTYYQTYMFKQNNVSSKTPIKIENPGTPWRS